ncbi:MAG: hypothetical protein ABEL51_15715 [Salinibacter sp.]
MTEHSLFDEPPARSSGPPAKDGVMPEPNTCRACGKAKRYDGNLTVLDKDVCALCSMFDRG